MLCTNFLSFSSRFSIRTAGLGRRWGALERRRNARSGLRSGAYTVLGLRTGAGFPTAARHLRHPGDVRPRPTPSAQFTVRAFVVQTCTQYRVFQSPLALCETRILLRLYGAVRYGTVTRRLLRVWCHSSPGRARSHAHSWRAGLWTVTLLVLLKGSSAMVPSFCFAACSDIPQCLGKGGLRGIGLWPRSMGKTARAGCAVRLGVALYCGRFLRVARMPSGALHPLRLHPYGTADTVHPLMIGR